MAFGQNFTDTTYGYIGNGGLLVAKLDENDRPEGGFFNLGHLSSASLSLSSEKVEFQDLVYGTKGVARSRVIRNTGELTLNLRSFSPEVMELALFGEVTDDVAEAGATYTTKAYKGRSIVVPGVISAVTSITANSEVLEEGVDYVISDGSIDFLKTGSIVDGDSVTVVYDKAAVRRIEGLVNSGVNIMIVFDGKNIEEGDTPVKVTYYKVSLSPAAARQLIGADYGEQEIKGTLLASKAVSGSGLSKMFKEEHVIAA
ncbi:hypothetical protein SBP02_11775 [Pseudomonas benzenivorans]|uniref:Uncharacterized protein n=1 Tax=Pseudomonas benzenivorans TaxID=556533 RepID=A0ABZ0PQM3_9PSED|nr:hypothetical protein [Pseudomonas benzenivorans]WPC03463.1 hypothetical protein SBP02_11775 [Pseudomonas benzenivorans]